MQAPNKKIGQYVFMGILVLHVLISCFIGIGLLTNPQLVLAMGFQVEYTPQIQILTVVIGMQVLFLGSLALLGILWTRKKSLYGVYTGIAVGVYMFAFGFALFFIMGLTNGFAVDSSRGLITLIAAYFAYNELKSA